MKRPRMVNLLDDFALGGVTRMLSIFEEPVLSDHFDARLVPVPGGAFLAQRYPAEVIATHFPPNWRRLVYLASLKLRNPRSTLIHVEHSYTRAWESESGVSSPRRFRLMLRLAFSLYDRIVCVSHGQAAWLVDVAGIPANKLEVVYPATSNPGLERVALPTYTDGQLLRIGAYGRFCAAKGFDRLIEAMNNGCLPGCHLLIGGYGEEEQSLRELAGGNPDITFVGRVEDVPAFLAGCDVVAVPSRWEAYGLVATEAREAGRPILVSPVDGLPEQVGDAGLVVDFSRPDEIARAIAALNPQRISKMARSARAATVDFRYLRALDWRQFLTRLTGCQSTREFLR